MNHSHYLIWAKSSEAEDSTRTIPNQQFEAQLALLDFINQNIAIFCEGMRDLKRRIDNGEQPEDRQKAVEAFERYQALVYAQRMQAWFDLYLPDKKP